MGSQTAMRDKKNLGKGSVFLRSGNGVIMAKTRYEPVIGS